MPFNSVGVATRAGSPVVNGAISDASDVNTPVADIIAMLNLVSLRDGRAPMTGNLNMAGFRIQSVPNAIAGNEVAAFGQIQAAVTDFADDLIGLVGFFARASAPNGWLKANGAAVSRVTYATLFARIATFFGPGDGVTTFNLPDLRGEFPRGWDDGRNIDTGRVFGSSQLDAIQNLTGSFSLRSASLGEDIVIASNGAFSQASGVGGSRLSAALGTVASTTTVSFSLASAGARSATETRARNVALLACIKF